MKLSSIGIPVVLLLLVAGVFFAGCSDNSSATTTATTATQGVITTVAAAGAQYSAGDIIKNPKSTANTGLLIIDYDAGTDMYERAYIYPNSDGSWGYRLDSKTAKVSRASIEKIYTEKVSTIVVSAVPIGTPTKAVTATATPTTKTTTVATTTATTAAVSAPKVTDITPYSGKTGTTVEITELEGQYFRDGANVSLKKSGEDSIVATDIDVESANLITCTFVIPSGTQTGYWSVVVTNTDGQYHEFQNGFTILQGDTTATTTTSTSTTSSDTVTITQIQDTLIVTGGGADYKPVSILGTNLTAASSMKLIGTNTYTSTTYSATAISMSTGYFDLPSGNKGTYHVTIYDSAGNLLATSSDTLTIQ
jgi:hypothetical protein